MSITPSYEVELKYRLTDLPGLEQFLAEQGQRLGPPVEEVDQYYQHPARDFARTDEGLRIRRSRRLESSLERGTVRLIQRATQPDEAACFLTYKGPKIDETTKTRTEIDLPLLVEDVERWDLLLTHLGFQPVQEVVKIRRTAAISIQQREISLTVDYLPKLVRPTESGSFIEIETIVGRDGDELESAKEVLLHLAEQLALGEPIREGYLELILEKTKY
ncbi:MAG: class IV adenylate cyclase [Thermoguttaceae bacterium]